MNTTKNKAERIETLLSVYGDGTDGSCPTREQWENIFARPTGAPVSLINLFKMREQAEYPDVKNDGTGEEAFNRYAAVSMPSLAKAGGKFLLVAPFEGMFAGQNEEWDLIAIGSYPNTEALFNLFENEDYQAVFHHRTAACERQKVLICSG